MARKLAQLGYVLLGAESRLLVAALSAITIAIEMDRGKLVVIPATNYLFPSQSQRDIHC
ncbi:hypothetical protein [Cylindrospermopsis raciborskii]|uniref:hypothetical protein n=1 Tax=Cylindrospermopsis raciborskii TaxID=77022 RepID=UPI00136655DD|nr:hypothetical protein [Cylindrospermopsis raciborskii]MCZ2206433.1 hypothetical protein [Cylindrospermopsis raciborskii PAMP2011]